MAYPLRVYAVQERKRAMERLTQKDEQGNMLKELNEEQCKHRLDAVAGAVSGQERVSCCKQLWY